MNQKDIKILLEIFKSNRWKRISERMIEIDDYIVQKNKYLTCSCINPTKTNEGICYHKMFFIVLPFFEKFDRKIKNLKQYYKTAIDITKDEEIEKIYRIILDDLEGLERLE